MKTLDVPGGHLAYDVRGDGPTTVLLLHGGALDHRMWTEQVEALSSRATVIVPDARGHGRSSTPHETFRQCDDIAALIRHLGGDPAVLVGVSMGAGAAIDTALEHPDLVAGVVVSGAGTNEPYFNDPWILDIQAEWARTMAAGDAEGWVDATTQFVAGPHRALDDIDPAIVRLCHDMALDTVRAHATPDAVPPHHVVGSWDRLPEITVPVLAIIGAVDSDDHITMATRLAEGVASGEAVTIDDAAHYPNLEHPAEWNAAINTFLDRVASTD